VPKDLVYI